MDDSSDGDSFSLFFFKNCINGLNINVGYTGEKWIFVTLSFDSNIFAKLRRLGISNFLSTKCQIQPRVPRIHSGRYFKIHFQGERLPFVRESGHAVSEDVSRTWRATLRPRTKFKIKLDRARIRFAYLQRIGDRSSRAPVHPVRTHHDVPPPRMNWILQRSVTNEVYEFRARGIP